MGIEDICRKHINIPSRVRLGAAALIHWFARHVQDVDRILGEKDVDAVAHERLKLRASALGKNNIEQC